MWPVGTVFEGDGWSFKITHHSGSDYTLRLGHSVAQWTNEGITRYIINSKGYKRTILPFNSYYQWIKSQLN